MKSNYRYALTAEEATEIGTAIGIEWNDVDFDPADLADGMKVELEHGSEVDERVNITNDDLEMTAQIAWVHFMEDPDYYVMLAEMEGAMDDVRTPKLHKEGKTMRRRSVYNDAPFAGELEYEREEVLDRLDAIRVDLRGLSDLIADMKLDMDDKDLAGLHRMHLALDEFLQETRIHKAYEYLIELLHTY
jgi:hypothetical protein